VIAIVIVNYKGGTDTVECLESLLGLIDVPWRAIVIDNGSQDASCDQIELWAKAGLSQPVSADVWDKVGAKDCPRPSFATLTATEASGRSPIEQVTLIRSEANLGFAGANNIGMSFALNDEHCSHVWLLNNDTVVTPRAAAELMKKASQNPSTGMVGSTLVYYHRPEVVQGTGGSYNLALAGGYQIDHLAGADSLSSEASVEERMTYVIGASMFVTRRFIEEVGMMSDKYFLYFEELDWALRARGRFRLAWAPGSIVYHKEGGSIGTSSTGRPSDVSLYYMARSTMLFYRTHRAHFLAIALLRLLARAAKYVRSADWAGASAVLKGAKAGFGGV
jgi:GT2 family glycosyltransferase